jgi:hypothetical protein
MRGASPTLVQTRERPNSSRPLEETGHTLLTVPVVDQAALHGLLRKLRDLGVPILSINPAGPERPGNSSKEENR